MVLGALSVRIAVVDVGTNTTRLYMADVADGHVTAELTRISRVTRLGAGVDASGTLATDALAREYAVLDEYHRMIQAASPDRAVAVMTSAVRDAANGKDFAEDVSSRFGLDVHVISGDEEAQLTYLGATDANWADRRRRARRHLGPTLVFDIGGGSTELVIGHGDRVDFHISTQAGVVRQADRHIHSDPPTPAELDAVAAGRAHDPRSGRAVQVPLASGPGARCRRHPHLTGRDRPGARSLRPRKSPRLPPDGDRSATRSSSASRRCRSSSASEVTGLHPDRAIAILPGIVILTEVMDLFELDAIEVSEHDILRGAALHYSR